MKRLILMLAILLPCGVSRAVEPPENPQQAISDAVGGVVYQLLHNTDNYLSIWLSHNYNAASWEPTLRVEQNEITRLKKWASKLDDPVVKSAYEDWLDYYQRDLDSARNELLTQREKKRMDEFDEQNRQKRKLAAAQTIPIPPK
jgi:hypothetical protein